MNPNIALITFHQPESFFEGVDVNEDVELLDFLQQKGININSVSWNTPDIYWKQFDVVILKSPWDYHEQLEAFHNWINLLESLGIKVLNSPETIKWNSNKKYLTEIAAAQLPIIPGILVEKGQNVEWTTFFETWNTDKIVVKPCVSAGAKNTLLLPANSIEEKSAELKVLMQTEDYLVQPYLKEIEQGEWSLLFFGEIFSHAILKTPKDGDFRVQHSHGGSFKQALAKNSYIEKASAYVEKFAKGSLYVRVDGIIKDNEFYLMELELIEPYLYLASSENGYENYYQALMRLL
jgi:glutathione synthase/RimK-type ligase-like ATP-grasp enzyme